MQNKTIDNLSLTFMLIPINLKINKKLFKVNKNFLLKNINL